MDAGQLPELAMIECPRCYGDGFVDHGYDDEPNECDECNGTGEIEVCSVCRDVPGLEQGLEVCGCNRAALSVAA